MGLHVVGLYVWETTQRDGSSLDFHHSDTNYPRITCGPEQIVNVKYRRLPKVFWQVMVL